MRYIRLFITLSFFVFVIAVAFFAVAGENQRYHAPKEQIGSGVSEIR